MINTNDLRSFLTTAKTLHLTKAAKELGLSQPALSHSIKRLEVEIKTELFLRRKNGLLLTKAGELLLLKGQKIWDDLASVTEQLETGNEKKLQSLTVGMHASVASYILPFVLKTNKDYSLQFRFGLSREVNQWIQEGKIDCGIVINPYPHSNLILFPLSKDHFNLWVHKKNAKTERLFINSELHQTHALMRQLDKKGIVFKEIIEIPNLELIAKLVYEGAGVGILPEKVIKNFHSSDTKIYSSTVKPFIDHISFVYSEENKQNESIRKLKKILIKSISE